MIQHAFIDNMERWGKKFNQNRAFNFNLTLGLFLFMFANLWVWHGHHVNLIPNKVLTLRFDVRVVFLHRGKDTPLLLLFVDERVD